VIERMPQLKRKKEKKPNRKKNNFLKKSFNSLTSLKNKKIVFNPHAPLKQKQEKTTIPEVNLEQDFDFHMETIEKVDQVISEAEIEKKPKEINTSMLSPLEETIEFRDQIGRAAVSTELQPEQLLERNIVNGIPFFTQEINITDTSFSKYLNTENEKKTKIFEQNPSVNENDFSGLFYSKGIKLKLKKDKHKKEKESSENSNKTKNTTETNDENIEEENDEDTKLAKEIMNLKKSIEERKKSLDEKEQEISKFKNELNEIDQRKKDSKNDFENEKKLLTQEEKELKKLEKKLEKIDSKKQKEEEKTKDIKQIEEKNEDLPETELIEETEFDENYLDEDVKNLIPVIDDLLGQLPDEIIDDFANSNNFELYEKVVKKYKSK
jgi:hypothetical protein